MAAIIWNNGTNFRWNETKTQHFQGCELSLFDNSLSELFCHELSKLRNTFILGNGAIYLSDWCLHCKYGNCTWRCNAIYRRQQSSFYFITNLLTLIFIGIWIIYNFLFQFYKILSTTPFHDDLFKKIFTCNHWCFHYCIKMHWLVFKYTQKSKTYFNCKYCYKCEIHKLSNFSPSYWITKMFSDDLGNSTLHVCHSHYSFSYCHCFLNLWFTNYLFTSISF